MRIGEVCVYELGQGPRGGAGVAQRVLKANLGQIPPFGQFDKRLVLAFSKFDNRELHRKVFIIFFQFQGS